MKLIRLIFAISVFAIVVVVGIILFAPKKREVIEKKVEEDVKTFKAILYYIDDEGRLRGVEKDLRWKPLLEDRVKEVIKALKEPEGAYISAIPKSAEILDVFLDGSTVYLDFSDEFIIDHPGGTRGELETIYSIVNSITSTFEGIEKVKFLVSGKDIDTIKGHIYLGEPIGKNTEILNEP